MISTIIRGIDVSAFVPVYKIPPNYKLYSTLVGNDGELFITYKANYNHDQYVIVTTYDYIEFLISDVIILERPPGIPNNRSIAHSQPVIVNGQYFLYIRYYGDTNSNRFYGRLHILKETPNGSLILDMVIDDMEQSNFSSGRKDPIVYTNNFYHMIGLDIYATPNSPNINDLKHYYSADGVVWLKEDLPIRGTTYFSWFEIFFDNHFYFRTTGNGNQISKFKLNANGTINPTNPEIFTMDISIEYTLYLDNSLIFTNNGSNMVNRPMYTTTGVVNGSPRKHLLIDEPFASNPNYNYNTWEYNSWYTTDDKNVRIFMLTTRGATIPSDTIKQLFFVYNSRLKKLVYLTDLHNLLALEPEYYISSITYNSVSKKLTFNKDNNIELTHMDLDLAPYLA